jgi:hypothetical protein
VAVCVSITFAYRLCEYEKADENAQSADFFCPRRRCQARQTSVLRRTCGWRPMLARALNDLAEEIRANATAKAATSSTTS